MDPTELRTTAFAAIEVLAAYVERTQAGDGPPTARRDPAAVTADLDLHRLLREGGLDLERWPAWLEAYLADGVALHHPRELAHQVTPPDLGSALADLVHGVANQPMSIVEMGAAGAAAERAVVDWMVERVGWDAGRAGGVLTHGGSLANLTALLAARAAAARDAWQHGVPSDLVVLAPPAAHYSVGRAVGIMGLGEDAVVALATDELGRIDVAALPAAVDAVEASGRRVMALVAGACATATGLHDDLRAIGALCRERGVWLHVDGAHGASALVSPRLRGLLDGIELADSVVWDAHKMLRTSALCAAVLVRERERLPAAFQQHASYLDFSNAGGYDVLDRQVECTKAELGLKVLLNLAFRGERGMAEHVERQYALGHRLFELLDAHPAFAVPYEPETNIVCWTVSGEDDAGHARIRQELLAAGAFHLSTAEVAGRLHLRAVFMSPASAEDLRALLDAVLAARATAVC